MVLGSKLADHNLEWRSIKKVQEAISSENTKMLNSCIEHGADVNMIIDNDTFDCILIKFIY